MCYGRHPPTTSCRCNTIISRYHYNDVILSSMAPQITPRLFTQGAHHRKHQSSASLAFVWGIHRWLVNSLHKGPVTRNKFPFDDVIMYVFFWYVYRNSLCITLITYSIVMLHTVHSWCFGLDHCFIYNAILQKSLLTYHMVKSCAKIINWAHFHRSYNYFALRYNT